MNNKTDQTPPPKKGDKIFVPSSSYMYRGEDDFEGGLAEIAVVVNNGLPKDHVNYWMVGVKEHPETLYNWTILMRMQGELAAKYAGKLAHPDPDLREAFNQRDAGFK